jgi:hypothetical protein
LSNFILGLIIVAIGITYMLVNGFDVGDVVIVSMGAMLAGYGLREWYEKKGLV